MNEPFPFLFFGARPGEWHEGANCGHGYEVRFVTEPDAATRARIGEVFERSLEGGSVETSCRPWSWAGAWVQFWVGQSANFFEYREFFESITEALRRVHEVAPIGEAHYLNLVQPEQGGWEAWTLARQQAPSRAPRWPGFGRELLGHYLTTQPRERAAVATDEPFEVARVAARAAAQEARTGAASTDAEAALARGAIVLRVLEEEDAPPPPPPPPFRKPQPVTIDGGTARIEGDWLILSQGPRETVRHRVFNVLALHALLGGRVLVVQCASIGVGPIFLAVREGLTYLLGGNTSVRLNEILEHDGAVFGIQRAQRRVSHTYAIEGLERAVELAFTRSPDVSLDLTTDEPFSAAEVVLV